MLKIYCDVCSDDMTNDKYPMEIKTIEPNILGKRGEVEYVKNVMICCQHCSNVIRVSIAKLTQEKKDDAKKV